jgi:signal peptidase II
MPRRVAAGMTEEPACRAEIAPPFSGADMTDSGHSAPRALWKTSAFVTLPVVVLDQVSKYLVATHLKPFEVLTLIPHILALTYTLNPGAAFSLFTNLPPWLRAGFLVAVSVAAIVIIAVLLFRSRKVSIQTVALALILGGAVGNLTDRIVRGRVVDFIYVHYYGLSYPVFNIADSAITIGVTIVLLSLLFEQKSQAGFY